MVHVSEYLDMFKDYTSSRIANDNLAPDLTYE